MKTCFLAALVCAASAAAQNINIASPMDGQTVPSNQNITLQVQLPETISPALQVPQLVIGVLSCQSPDCSDIGNGTFLNAGGGVPQTVPFTPQRVDPALPAYQNYSVNLGNTAGTKLVRVMHVFGLGADLQATMEFKGVRVTSSDSMAFTPRWKRT